VVLRICRRTILSLSMYSEGLLIFQGRCLTDCGSTRILIGSSSGYFAHARRRCAADWFYDRNCNGVSKTLGRARCLFNTLPLGKSNYGIVRPLYSRLHDRQLSKREPHLKFFSTNKIINCDRFTMQGYYCKMTNTCRFPFIKQLSREKEKFVHVPQCETLAPIKSGCLKKILELGIKYRKKMENLFHKKHRPQKKPAQVRPWTNFSNCCPMASPLSSCIKCNPMTCGPTV
jgi:hypothetical protein